MAKIYGGRWQIVGELGKGGQGDVFRVKDLRSNSDEEYALKRLKNPKRHARFQNEIEATKRLSHGHIVRIIDHSALDAEAANLDETNYLVMPIAAGGDLSERGPALKGSLDTTVAVAQRLASALRAAHETGVIHRDVKPENVLFADTGNENVLLSDFGICLLRDAEERITDTDEAVGPRLFMAPELEGGRVLGVQPSVDIYSLGKVIYFMITGGVRLPREQFTDQFGADVFRDSERFRLLRLLLERMIAPVDRRIAFIQEVETQLKLIADWETHASTTALSPGTRQMIDGFKQFSADNQRQIRDNNEKFEAEKQRNAEILKNVRAVLEVELRNISAVISAGGAVETAVSDSLLRPHAGIQVQGGVAVVQVGVELKMTSTDMYGTRQHRLVFGVCAKGRVITQINPSGGVAPLPPHDQEFVVIPYYQLADSLQSGGFLTERPIQSQPALTRSFHPQSHLSVPRRPGSLAYEFRASQWPNNTDSLLRFVSTAIEHFVNIVRAGHLIVAK